MVKTIADRDSSKLEANKRTMVAYNDLLFSFCYIINSCEQNLNARIGNDNKNELGVPLECCRVLSMVALTCVKRSFNEGYNTKEFKVSQLFRKKKTSGQVGEQKDFNDYFSALENFNAESKKISNCLGKFFNNNDFGCFVDFKTINKNGVRNRCLFNACEIIYEEIDLMSSMSILTLIINIVFLKQLVPKSQGDFEWLKNMWMRLCFMLYGEKYFSYKQINNGYKEMNAEYELFKIENPYKEKKFTDLEKEDLRSRIKFIYSTVRQKFGLSEFEIEENLFRITHNLFEMRECHGSVRKDSVEYIKSVIIKLLYKRVEKIERDEKDSIIGNCLDNYYYIFSNSVIEMQRN